MADVEHMPLSERIKKAEYYARELSEHLRQSYLARLGDLRTSSKVFDADLVSDQQMLDRIQSVLKADAFATEVYEKLKLHLEVIRQEMQEVVLGPDTDLGRDTTPDGTVR